MNRVLTIITFLFIVVLAGSLMAEITLTGDARLRPRLDLQDKTVTDSISTQTKTTDGYYYYRARLNAKTDIGDGWFGHVQLGTNGFAYWTGKFGEGATPSSSSISGGGKGSVDFMLIYFGRKTKEFGYMGGLIPINALTNPILDLHYYSHKMVDVPYFLYSNNSAHGFTGYIGLKNGSKINATVMVDNNLKKTETTIDSLTLGPIVTAESDMKDQYTVMLDAPLKLSDFVVQPVAFLTAIATDGAEKPMTFGANITTPKIGDFTLYGSFGSSTQSESGTAEYSAWYARLKAVGKLGKGTFTGWVDIANKEFDITKQQNKFMYFWIAYEIPVYKSDVGSVSIKPTWRHIAEKHEDAAGSEIYDFTREKIELTIDFKFK